MCNSSFLPSCGTASSSSVPVAQSALQRQEVKFDGLGTIFPIATKSYFVNKLCKSFEVVTSTFEEAISVLSPEPSQLSLKVHIQENPIYRAATESSAPSTHNSLNSAPAMQTPRQQMADGKQTSCHKFWCLLPKIQELCQVGLIPSTEDTAQGHWGRAQFANELQGLSVKLLGEGDVEACVLCFGVWGQWSQSLKL